MIRDFSRELKALLVRETDLRRRVEHFDALIDDATLLAERLAPVVEDFLERHTLDKVSAPLQSTVRAQTRELTYGGLITHFVLFNSPYRSTGLAIDPGQLSSEWAARSLTCLSTMSAYSKDNGGYPELIFGMLYSGILEPLQKRLKLGWWRRFRNEPKFRHFFASGLVLGMLVDMRVKGLSDKSNGRTFRSC